MGNGLQNFCVSQGLDEKAEGDGLTVGSGLCFYPSVPSLSDLLRTFLKLLHIFQ